MISGGLSAEKERLLAVMLNRRGLNKRTSGSDAIPRQNQDRSVLSFSQQRLWFLEQLKPDTATYNIPIALRLSGSLDREALEHSFNEIVRRHEVLRTVFESSGPEPVQVVTPYTPMLVPVIDLTAAPQPQREQQCRRLADAEAQSPFDLATGPLVRLRLVRLSQHDHVLILNMHHIVSDAWSLSLLVNELATLYAAFRDGRPSPLPELALQYSDFAQWQRNWLSGDRLDNLLEYWTDHLAGAPPLLQLAPAPPTAGKQAGGADFDFHFDGALAAAVGKLGSVTGATPFMVLLAGFKALLYRYTGQRDIIVGTPIANRQRQELEPLIGFFVNTLALRTDVGGNPTFGELLTRVRQTALGAYAHQDLPFDRLVQQLGPDRASHRAPVFQVMFSVQSAPAPALQLSGLEATPFELTNTTAKFDLTMQLENTPHGINGSVEYNTELFDHSTIERFTEHYRRLLTHAVHNPDLCVSELPMLSDRECTQLLSFPTTSLEPVGTTIHALFEQQVDQTPERIALTDADSSVSYQELDARANQVAHHLISLGVGPESRVAICVPRSVSLVIAVLGVLKAGAAYLPLDPSYPAERLSFMLADGQAAVMLTTQQLVDRLPEHSAQIVLMEQDWTSQPTTRVERRAEPQNLAYLIYTSGSTGRPKGVMIEHRNAVTFIAWCHTIFSEAEVESVLASTSLCFDLSVFEMFVPLSRGGKLLLVQSALELETSQPVTLINTVPSIMAELIRFRALPPQVRTINLAGEPLPLNLVRTLAQHAPHARILNLYGPSEDTTYSTYYEVPQELDRAPFVGVPIAETQAYVLDEHLQLLPLGVVGEIYLSGSGLARGYLDRPDLTAERFVPDPFTTKAGRRMYKTGDRGRLHADGNIECLGRVDHQVKIRGCRIELGEIEAVLSRHSGVNSVAAVVREDQPGQPRLVAYIESQQQEAVIVPELREAARAQLPEYMVPVSFVVLQSLPQTLNGKVDRKALPAPAAFNESCVLEPRDATEATLATIWESLLGRRAGIRENFFDIGGHSLLALRLQHEVKKQLGVDLPLAALFEVPTIENLARSIQDGASGRDRTLIPIQPHGTQPPFFCVHPIGGGVLCYARLAAHVGAGQPFYGLHASSNPMRATIEEMAASYLSSIRTVQPTGPYYLGGWSMGGVVAYEMARQLRLLGEEVAALVLLDSFLFSKDDALDEQELQRNYHLDATAMANAEPSSEELERHWPLYQSNFQALVNYMPKPFDGCISLIESTDSHEAHPSPFDTWSRVARFEIHRQVVPGDHYSFLREPGVVTTGQALQAILQAAQRNTHEHRSIEQ